MTPATVNEIETTGTAAPAESNKARRLLTKRFLLAAAALAIATGLNLIGHISGTEWVYALGVILVGHGTQDVVNTIREK